MLIFILVLILLEANGFTIPPVLYWCSVALVAAKLLLSIL